jgi:hypothetical protein
MDSARDIDKLRNMQRAEIRAIDKETGENPAQTWASFTSEGSLHELTALGSVLEQVYCSINVSAEKTGKDIYGSGGSLFICSSFPSFGINFHALLSQGCFVAVSVSRTLPTRNSEFR